MKAKLIFRTLGLIILVASLSVLSSCSKNANESLTKEQKEIQDSNVVVSSIDDKDITESDEDLTTVDYKEFYDQLAPYGEWVQVQAEDVGLKSKIASAKSTSNNSFSFSNLFGVKDAYADADMGMVFVWKPSPDLTIAGSVGDVPEYRPYSNGQWINTDAGWYFRGRTPYEETVSHHGRWVHSKHGGWMWVPGRVWAPAWVDWRQNDDYVSWAPIPPSVYFNDGNISISLMDDDDYMIVNKRHFYDPDIYRYYNPYYDDGSRISVSLMEGTVGLVVINNTIINRGPDVNIIQNFYGKNFDMVKIQHVRNFNEIRYSDKEYNVYSPNFKRYKNKDNSRFTKNEPKSFKNFNDLPERKSAGNDFKKDEKQIGKDNNRKDNINKNIGKDNVGKQNDNTKMNKQNNNTKVNKQNNNNKESKQNSNTKVNKQNNNNKESKQNNNTKVNKQNNNNKESKQNNNTKVNKRNNNNKENKQNSSTKENKQNNNNKENKQNNNNNGKQKK